MLDSIDLGTVVQWAMLGLIVGGAIYVGRRGEAKKISKEVNDENMQLADARGKKIDDLQEELTAVLERLSLAEVKIQMLQDERVDRIVEGVVVGLRPFLQPK